MARGDLTDRQWERLSGLLPPEQSGRRGHPYKEHRSVVYGILWVDRTGAPWRDLPERYGPWQTCYDRFVRWQRMGVWQKALEALQAEEDGKGNVVWHNCGIDGTIVKAHQHAAGARRREKGGARSSRTRRSAAAGAD